MDEVVEFLRKHVEYCNEILHCTNELKKLLSYDSDEDTLIDKIHQRGMLIERVSKSQVEFDNIFQYLEQTEDYGRKSLAKDLIKKIQHLLYDTSELDKGMKSLIEEKINEINSGLEKVQEGKNFARNLNKQNENNPSFINICG